MVQVHIRGWMTRSHKGYVQSKSAREIKLNDKKVQEREFFVVVYNFKKKQPSTITFDEENKSHGYLQRKTSSPAHFLHWT